MGNSINFKNALGIHPLAIKLRDQRSELLASNIANADTPNYKARDMDFRAVLKGVQQPVEDPPLPLAITHPSHLSLEEIIKDPAVQYRVPFQPSMDGNTVESEQEHVRYGANALQYQASLNFISGDFVGLKNAIRGE
jgi:flagellar basal-body rod protein FlgB